MKFFKYKILIILGCFLSGCSVGTSTIEEHSFSRILQANNHVKPEVVAIMKMLGFEDVPTRVDAFTGKFFLTFARKRNVERWHLQDEMDLTLKAKILDLFEKLGYFNLLEPQKKTYDYIVVLGATLQRIRIRLATLKKYWERGIRCKKIIFLTGARPLEPFEGADLLADFKQTILPIKENWQLPTEYPQTEAEIFMAIWNQAQLPEDLAAIEIECVDTPMQKWPDGKIQRPNTGDIVKQWLSRNPTPGDCLFISNQPHVGYQDALIRRFISKDFLVEAVGLEVKKEDQTVSILLDALVRELAIEAVLCGLWNEETLESYLKQ